MTAQLDITKQELAIVQGILQSILPNNSRVWVFGSRAKHMTRHNSDLDLAIDASSPLNKTTLMQLASAFEESHLPYTVDLVDLQQVEAYFKDIIDEQKVSFPLWSKVPELRFPEFEDALTESKLGGVAKFFKGKGISKADISENGKTPCIRYGELYTTYDIQVNEIASYTNLPEDELVFSEGGEVLIPASGETSIDISTAVVVTLQNIALGGDLNIIKSNLNGVFLAYYLNSNKKIDIAKLAQGNSVVHLYSSQLSSLWIKYPQSKEQQKIAIFLSSIDDKLTKLRRKHELLVQYKCGLMQQLFSQAIRFKQDDGSEFPEWEDKILTDLASRQTQKNNDDAISLVFTNSATKGVVNQQDYFDKDIANANNLEGYYIVEKGDYVYNPRISVHAPVGPINKNHLGTGLMSPLYSIFRFHQSDDRFYELYFKSTFWHRYMCAVANYGARHDRMNISTADFMNMPLPTPCEAEQQKIADCLSSFDAKIDAVAKQIQQLDEFKKGLLQKMFV